MNRNATENHNLSMKPEVRNGLNPSLSDPDSKGSDFLKMMVWVIYLEGMPPLEPGRHGFLSAVLTSSPPIDIKGCFR